MLKILSLSAVLLAIAGSAQGGAKHVPNHAHTNAAYSSVASAKVLDTRYTGTQIDLASSSHVSSSNPSVKYAKQTSVKSAQARINNKASGQGLAEKYSTPVFNGRAKPVSQLSAEAIIHHESTLHNDAGSVLSIAPSADSVPHSSFTQAPFIKELAQQISTNASQYSIGKINLKRVTSSANSSSDRYYVSDDGLSSMLVKNPSGSFSALLNYEGKSYRFNASTVSVLVNEFGNGLEYGAKHDESEHEKSVKQAAIKHLSKGHSGFGNSFWESYQLNRSQSAQSRQAGKAFYKNFVSNSTKKVRVLVSENAIIEEYQNSGEVNFSSLYERIQTGIDFANLALVTSGVDAFQLEVSEVAVQRLPYNYKDDVIVDDIFKRVAFPIWGEQDATFQMTALALTQNKADIIYNLGAREHFQNNACGFASIGVNGKKTNTQSYSTDHTYPVAINIKLGCETGRTPVHELGHTIGLNHERDNAGNNIVPGSSTPYAYNFGFTSRETPAYSIMSYGLGCTEANDSASCERANFFSSPKLRYGDTSFGISTPDPDAADAVRFLNDTWALRFSNQVNPMTITPLLSGGFTLNWDSAISDADSQVLVISKSAHLRYNYVLDNHIVYNQEKIEIPLPANQSSYTLSTQQMLSLGLQDTNYDTVTLFTGHVNEYDDIVVHLQAQLHAGHSLFAPQNASENGAIVVDGRNLETPQAGDELAFTFDISSIPNFSINDVKLMTVLDAQYNSGFTTAVARREFNPTNPMLDFFEHEIVQNTDATVQLRLTLSADYRDYVGFLRNRETSNYKFPVVGFYFAYSGGRIDTSSQEVAIDLSRALDVVPFIQAESLVKVIDNDREEPLSLIFSSTQEIFPSDMYTSVRGASAYQIGDVVSSVKQLPNQDGKFIYEVIAQNPQAIDDEGNYYASVSFGLDSLNLFSTTMIVASSNLMFDENNASRVRVSSLLEMPLSFGVTNLPPGEFDEEVSISTPDVGDNSIVVRGNLQRVNEQQGIVSFMFNPKALNKPTRLRVNAQALVGKSTDKKKAQHWVDVEYNVAPQIVASKTHFSAKPGEAVTIPVPYIDDADSDENDIVYAWEKMADAPTFNGQAASIVINIASDALPNTVYHYNFEVSDGIDSDALAYSITVDPVQVSQTTQVTQAPVAAVQATPSTQAKASQTTPSQTQNDAQSGGAIGIILVSVMFPLAFYRRFVNAR